MRLPWKISVPTDLLSFAMHRSLQIAKGKIFTQSKNAEVIITIHDFALPNHNELEGRIIRCSDDNGLYIVGCQMPEDNFYILEYVENNLNK